MYKVYVTKGYIFENYNQAFILRKYEIDLVWSPIYISQARNEVQAGQIWKARSDTTKKNDTFKVLEAHEFSVLRPINTVDGVTSSCFYSLCLLFAETELEALTLIQGAFSVAANKQPPSPPAP